MVLTMLAQAAPDKAGSGEVAIAAVIVSGIVAVLSPLVAGIFQLRAADRAAERARAAAHEAWERDEARTRRERRAEMYARVASAAWEYLTEAHATAGDAVSEQMLSRFMRFTDALFAVKFGASSDVRAQLDAIAAAINRVRSVTGLGTTGTAEDWDEIGKAVMKGINDLYAAAERELGLHVPST